MRSKNSGMRNWARFFGFFEPKHWLLVCVLAALAVCGVIRQSRACCTDPCDPDCGGDPCSPFCAPCCSSCEDGVCLITCEDAGACCDEDNTCVPCDGNWVVDWAVLGVFAGENLDDHIAGGCGYTERNIDPSLSDLTQGRTWIQGVTTSVSGAMALNFKATLGEYGNSNAYAHTYFHNPTTRDVRIRVGCSDKFELFLDGMELTTNSGASQFRYEGSPHTIVVDEYVSDLFLLGAGWHRIMVHESNDNTSLQADWLFTLRFDDGNSGPEHLIGDLDVKPRRSDIPSNEGVFVPSAEAAARPPAIRDWLILGNSAQGSFDGCAGCNTSCGSEFPQGCMTDCRNDVDVLAANNGQTKDQEAVTPSEDLVEAGTSKTWTDVRVDSVTDFSNSAILLNFNSYYGLSGSGQGDADRAVYLHTYCYNPGPDRPAQVLMSADDAGQVWVNGARAIGRCSCGTTSCERDISGALTLMHGTNKILVRVDQNQSEWGATVALVEPATDDPLPNVMFSLDAPSEDPDCNGNKIPDADDITTGYSTDCDTNGIPDECDVPNGDRTANCNGNGLRDVCEIVSGMVQDCNGNGIPDSCDIADQTEEDCNSNGRPDSCDVGNVSNPVLRYPERTGGVLVEPLDGSQSGLETADLTTGLTAQDLVDTILGGGITLTSVTYTGNDAAAGTFSGGQGIIGFDDGIILSSGDIAYVEGPNQSDWIDAQWFDEFGNWTHGDPDLDLLVSPDITYNASVLELEFTVDASCPSDNVIQFQFVFASDEYNEWVYQFNDVFAFYLNGENIALVPGSTDPVSVDNVNCGYPFGDPNSKNCQFYRNNDLSDGGGSIDTEMDGLTTVFTVTGHVYRDRVNTLKLALADTGDAALDSNVFIKGASLTCTPPTGACCDTTDLSCEDDKLESECPTGPGSTYIWSVGLNCIDVGCMPYSEDCNSNGIPDECDLRDCPSGDWRCQDVNSNGKPDECDGTLPNPTVKFYKVVDGQIDWNQEITEANECELVAVDGTDSGDGIVLYHWDLDGTGFVPPDIAGSTFLYSWISDGVCSNPLTCHPPSAACDPADPDCVAYGVGLYVKNEAGLSGSTATPTTIKILDTSVTSSDITITGATTIAAGERVCFAAGVNQKCDPIAHIQWDFSYEVSVGFQPELDDLSSQPLDGAVQCTHWDNPGDYALAVRAIEDDEVDADAPIQTLAVTVEAGGAFTVHSDRMAVEATYQYHEPILPGGQTYVKHRARLNLLNKSTDATVNGPVYVVFDNLKPTGTTLTGDLNTGGGHPLADVVTSGQPYLCLLETGDSLAPGARSQTVEVEWQVPTTATADQLGYDAVPYSLQSPPEFITSPVTFVQEGKQYVYAACAKDPDGDPIYYELVSGHPTGMQIHPLTGVVTWTPSQTAYDDNSGNPYAVTIRAKDGHLDINSEEVHTDQTFDITVGEINVAPYFTSEPNTTAVVGTEYAYKATYDDDDVTDVLNLFADVLPGDAQLSPTGRPDEVVWTSPQAGVHLVVLTVADSGALSDTQAFNLFVEDCAETPPAIVPIQTGPSNLQAAEGELFSQQVILSQELQGPPYYDLEVAPEGMWITETGLIQWIPSYRSHGVNKIVRVLVIDQDTGCSDTEVFRLDVADRNASPRINTTTVPAATEGQLWTYRVDAVDDDGDPLNYFLVAVSESQPLPTGLTINGSTGSLRWTPSQTAYLDAPVAGGVYPVKIRVTDSLNAFAETTINFSVNAVNLPPVITGPPSTVARENVLYESAVGAQDPDGDPLTYAVLEKPDSIGIDFDTTPGRLNVLVWDSPALGDSVHSPYHIVIAVTDSASATTLWPFDLRVFPASFSNQPPQITSEPSEPFYIERGASPPDGTYSYNVTAADDGGSVTFLVDMLYVDEEGYFEDPIGNLPGFQNITDLTATLTWTPDGSTPEGLYFIGVYVRDGYNVDSDTQWFGVYVFASSSGQPPQIVSERPPQTAKPGIEYTYQVEAVDPDATDTLVYSLTEKPMGMTIDESSGLVSWMPTESQIDTHWVTVRVDDVKAGGGTDGYAWQRYSILVSLDGDNQAPQLDSVSSYDAEAGTEYVATLTASDPNGDPVEFELTKKPASMTLARIDAKNAEVRWNTTAADLGQHKVLFHLSDGKGGEADGYFTVTIWETTYNEAPDVQPCDPPSATVALVGQPYSYCIKVKDVDSPPDFDYVLEASPPGGEMDIADQDASAPSGEGRAEITWSPTAADVGVHEVRFRVIDSGGAHTVYWFSLTVTSGATAGHAPNITSSPPVVAQVGIEYEWIVDVFDEDEGANANFTYFLETRPGGMDDPEDLDGGGLPPKSGRGRITWVPAVDQIGTHAVRLRVTDAQGAYISYPFTITVSRDAKNLPPSIISDPPQLAQVGQPYRYRVVVADPNKEVDFDYAVEVSPSVTGLTLTDEDDPLAVPGSGGQSRIDWTPQLQGTYWVTLTVTDGDGASAILRYSLAVSTSGTNHPPLITSRPRTTAPIGPPGYSYTVTVFDEDNETQFAYNLIGPPSGMTINDEDNPPNPGKATISWTPQAGQAGTHPIQVTVTDQAGSGLTVVQQFTITVSSDGSNRAPIITSNPVTAVVVGRPYSYFVKAEDHDTGDSIASYSLGTHPGDMAINSTTGEVTWANPTPVGTYDVVVRATDTNGATTEQPYKLQVRANSAPVICSTPVPRAFVGISYAYPLIVCDPDDESGFTYSLSVDPLPEAGAGAITESGGVVTWNAPHENDANKTFTVTVAATDPGSLTGPAHTFSIRVLDPDGGDAVPPEVSLSLTWDDSGTPRVIAPDSSVAVGKSVTSHILVTDDVKVDGAKIIVTGVDGNPLPGYENDGKSLTLADGAATDTFTASAVGAYTVKVEATDAGGNTSHRMVGFYVQPAGDADKPTALITSPDSFEYMDLGDGTTQAKQKVLEGPTELYGVANDDNFYKYTLAYRRSVDVSEPFTVFKEVYYTGLGSPVSPASLGTLDTSTLANGLYDVRLQVWDTAGRKSEDYKQYVIQGNLKVGNFAFGVVDMQAPVGNIPITISRSYDSSDKGSGDFGVGWRFDLASMSLEETSVLGEGWIKASGGFLHFCYVDPMNSHTVNVTWPDGRLESFEAVVDYTYPTYCSELFDCDGVRFLPYLGTTSTLMFVGDQPDTLTPTLEDAGAAIIEVTHDDTEVFNPRQYKLIDVDGTEYMFIRVGNSRRCRLQEVKDRNDNVITISENGITSTTGAGFTIQRDGLGRIIQIIDPESNRVRYVYDGNGDLVQFIDQENNVTRYRYNDRHNLIEVIDPRGLSVAQNVYDDDGRLWKVIDADGYVTTFEYDTVNRTQTITDRRGSTTTYSYDEKGSVLSEAKRLDASTVYTTTFGYQYDGSGKVTQKTTTDATGTRQMVEEFDSRENPTRVQDFDGRVIEATYNDHNQVLTHKDAMGRPATFEYNSNGNLTRMSNPETGSSEQAYDEKGRLKSTVDAIGALTEFQYDAAGRLTGQVDALKNTTTLTRDYLGNVLTEQRTVTIGGTPTTILTTNEYDGRGRLKSTTDALNRKTINRYNSIGEVSSVTSPQGIVRYEYDARGNQTKTIYPDDTFDLSEYDAGGNLTASIDRDGRRTDYEYDALGRLTKTIEPGDTSRPETEMHYDAIGRVTQELDELDHPTSYSYAADTATKTTSRTVTAANQLKTVSTFDGNGKLIKTELKDGDQLLNRIEHQYDSSNRLTKTVFNDGHYVAFEYDDAGRKTAETDQENHTTWFDYDQLGRLTLVTDARNKQTKYEYDELGNMTRQIDAAGRATVMEYDKLGRLTKRTLPLTDYHVDLAYDEAGNLSKRSTYGSAGLAHEVTYGYDVNNRLASKTLPAPYSETIEYDYTPAGLRTQAGAEAFAYDGAGRLTRNTKGGGTVLEGRKVEYAYDAAGNRTQLTVKNPDDSISSQTTFQHDNLNRLTKVIEDSDETVYVYNPVGTVSKVTYPNKTQTIYGYDSANQLTLVENQRPDGASGMETFSKYRYVLDKAGHRKQLYENEGVSGATPRTVVYDYDAIYRLTRETATQGTDTFMAEYTYDDVGNRLSLRVVKSSGGSNTETLITYQYDANDRLTKSVQGGPSPFATLTKTGDQMYAEASSRWSHYGLKGFGLAALGALCVPVLLMRDRLPLGRRARRRRIVNSAVILFMVVLMAVGPENVQAAYINSALYQSLAAAGLAQTSQTETTYQYDAAGNLIEERQGTGENDYNTYVYDAENRLRSSIIRLDKSVPETLTYTYDADGVRTSKSVQIGADPPAKTFYVVDKNRDYAQVLEERDKNGVLMVRYVYGLDLIAQVRPGDSKSYNHYDGMGSTRQLTNGPADPLTTPPTIQNSYTYEAFGQRLQSDPADTVSNNYRYTGEQYDSQTDSYYLRARYYAPSTGRFTGRDLAEGEPQAPASHHKYVYTTNNPVDYVDPSGMMSFGSVMCAIAIGAIIGGITGGILESIKHGPQAFLEGAIRGAIGGAILTLLTIGAGVGLAAGLSALGIGISTTMGIFLVGAGMGFYGIFENARVLINSQDSRERTAAAVGILFILVGGIFGAKGAFKLCKGSPEPVNPNPTRPLPTTRPIARNPHQNAECQRNVSLLKRLGGKDIRVDQQQVTAEGVHVGRNRPDLQGTIGIGRFRIRVYIEYDTSTSGRALPHQQRILKNDPWGIVIRKTID